MTASSSAPHARKHIGEAVCAVRSLVMGGRAPELLAATPTHLWMQTQPPLAIRRAAVLAIGAVDLGKEG
jgi:hypothetical protein